MGRRFLQLVVALVLSIIVSSYVYSAGNDEYTKLLIHGNETSIWQDNGTFNESSDSQHLATIHGNTNAVSAPSVDENPDQSGFGSAIFFDGIGDYLSIPFSDDWNFGNGNFSIDLWVYKSAEDSIYEMALGYQIGNTGFYLDIGNDNPVNFYVYELGLSLRGISLPIEVWQHIAVVRSDDNWYLFQDGNLTSSAIKSGSLTNVGASLIIGNNRFGVSNFLNGYIDELRISKGIARWTETFTRPDEPSDTSVPCAADYNNDGVVDMHDRVDKKNDMLQELEDWTENCFQPNYDFGINIPYAIAADTNHTVGINPAGEAIAAGYNNSGQCDVDWVDVIQVEVGTSHSLGLINDGTVLAVGNPYSLQCDVGDWEDIKQITAGAYHSLGLQLDGTVLATGSNADGQCNVAGWTDIVQVEAIYYHSVGLKADGTVVATGYNVYGQCDVAGWTNIVYIEAGAYHTLGLKSDGTVVAIGYDTMHVLDVDAWTDIIQISSSRFHTVGLKADGSVVATGYNGENACNVDTWQDIVQITTGHNYTAGVQSDGTVLVTGNNADAELSVVETWTIMTPN